MKQNKWKGLLFEVLYWSKKKIVEKYTNETKIFLIYILKIKQKFKENKKHTCYMIFKFKIYFLSIKKNKSIFKKKNPYPYKKPNIY